jgi:hypothetical protein
MQPTPLTAIQSRLDLPDPGRCTECKMPKEQQAQPRRSRIRKKLRRR